MRHRVTPWASLALALLLSSAASAQVPPPPPPIEGVEITGDVVFRTQEPAGEPSGEQAGQEAQPPDAPSPLLTQIQTQQYPRTIKAVFDARIRYELGEDPGAEIEAGTTPPAGGAAPPPNVVFPDDMPADVRAKMLEQLTADGVIEAPVTGEAVPPEAGDESDPAADDAALEASRNAARFHFWVMAGAWPEVERFLGQTAGEDAPAIFAHLLAQLAAQDQVMLPVEALHVASLAPEPLNDDQVDQLIALLEKAGTRGSLEAVPPRLPSHPQFDPADAGGRARGARLLAGLELLEALEPYLPEMQPDETRPDVLAQHARYHQFLAERAPDFSARMVHLDRAFALLRAALNSEEAAAAEREQVLGVLLGLLPELPETEVAEWRATLFADGRGFGLSALSRVCAEMEQFQRQRTLRDERIEVVREAKALGEVLVGLTPMDQVEDARAALGLVGMRLLNEAEYSLGADPNQYPYYQYTPNGRFFTFIETGDLLQWMPSVAWMARVDDGLAERLMEVRVRLAAQARLPEDALATVRLAAVQRAPLAQELAETFLEEWTAALESQRVEGVDTNRIFFVNGVRQTNPGSAPLTRAHQMRSLAKLAEVIQAFGELGLEPMEPEALVEGFAACHSSAEVYRVEDIERLLGPIDAMPARMATALADNMRRNLSSRWRSARVQAAAGTQRSKPQMEAEIERGYVLAERILERAIALEPQGWLNVLTQAALMFDYAEFSHARDPDLRDYAPIRDGAFASFGRAARLYADELDAGTTEPTALPYTLWFSAALGASELGYLTPNTRPANDQVDLLREALDALDEDARAGHLDLFAVWVGRVQVPSIMKPRFLRHALRVLGEHAHPSAEMARARLRLYDELVQEVLLVAEVDGLEKVTADDPFGVRLSLRYTAALEREAGGFGKYLQNQVYGAASGAQVDYRDRFEEHIREKLYEGFEVDSIHFHKPEVEDRPVGVHGWMEKPLAYLVLRARDAAVDRLPSLQLDMDFSDGQGTVLLPVSSQLVLLDARADVAPPRPYEKLEVEQVLDPREWQEQKLHLEVRTRGRGVLPELAALLPGLDEIPGFRVTDVESHALNITELDAASTPVMPLTERSWTVRLAPVDGAAATARFAFPEVALENDGEALKRYSDLDLVDAEPVVQLDSGVLDGGGLPWWGWMLLLAVIAGGGYVWSQRRGEEEAVEEELPLPARVTPLSAIAYLRRVGERGPVLARDAWREELEGEVRALEQRSFAAGGETPSEDELRAMLRRWRERAVA